LASQMMWSSSASADSHQLTMQYVVSQKLLPDKPAIPMEGLSLQMEGLDPNVDGIEVICSSSTDAQGRAQCYLSNCQKNISIAVAVRVTFVESPLYTGPWEQRETVTHCSFDEPGPIPVIFEHRQLAVIEQETKRLASQLPPPSIGGAAWKGLILAGDISSYDYAAALLSEVRTTSSDTPSPSWEEGNADKKVVDTASSFKELAAAYAAIAAVAPDGELKQEAQAFANQYTAYLVSTMNVGVARIDDLLASPSSTPGLDKKIRLTGSYSDFYSNTGLLWNTLPSVTQNESKVTFIKKKLEDLSKSEGIMNQEFKDWSDAYRAAASNVEWQQQ